MTKVPSHDYHRIPLIHPLLLAFGLAICVLSACGDDDESTNGMDASVGADMSTGGASMGGISTGGTSTGGISTGGISTGGTSTGGAGMGGTNTGGASMGGTSTGACTPEVVDPVDEQNVVELGPDHHRAETSIVIDRSTAQVWEVLTDFDTMPNWSSTFQGLTGDVRDGGEIEALYLTPDPMTGEPMLVGFPHVLSYTEGVEFSWSDPLVGLPGIVDEHIFRVEALSDCQTRFIQNDTFQGTDPNVTTEVLANFAIDSYAVFNAELKAEVESRFP